MRIDGGAAVRVRLMCPYFQEMAGPSSLSRTSLRWESLSAAICEDGYRVVWVRSGEDALVELGRHPVRLVLLDIGLPGKDGFDVCRAIRARSRVPILMLTARDEEPDRSSASSWAPTTTSPSRSPRASSSHG